MELEALCQAVAAFDAKGASLALISPQRVEHSRELALEKHLRVPVLSDPGNAVASDYGLKYDFPEDLKRLYQNFGIHLNEYNGDDTWSLPLPARFIINQDQIVQYAEINADYTVRPDPEETLAAL